MATRENRTLEGERRPRRRWAVSLLTGLAVGGVLVWLAPLALVLTTLRNRPLEAAFAGIDGRIRSRAATWSWLGASEYRDVVLTDRNGRVVAAVRRIVIDRGLLALAFDPTHLGTVRLIGSEALVEVRRGGSTLEDVLAPWLAARGQGTKVPLAFELEVVDGAIELVDLERQNAWRITELLAAGTVRADATLAGWAVSGRLVHTQTPAGDLAAAFAQAPPAGGSEPSAPTRLDRTTIAAGATATLSRGGGWSVSSPEAPVSAAPRELAIACNRVPLGISRVLATRFDAEYSLHGVADVRLDIQLPMAPGQRAQPQGTRIAGMVSGAGLALCRADTQEEFFALERCEVPLDVSLEGPMLTIRELKASSPLFKAEASGRIGLPQGDTWEWAESLIGDDFALAADIDLAAAARAIPGGLQVRPDVRITAGQLQLAAAAHAEGVERVLEVRAASRDLGAVQGKRQLRWSEPFIAWMRGKRGPARGERLRIEEARLASSAVEVSAAGTSESSSIQWTVDIAKLVNEAAELLDLTDAKVAGTSRGRLDIDRVPATGVSTARLSAVFGNLLMQAEGQPEWRDAEIAIDAEAAGSLTGGAAVLDSLSAQVSAADDRFKMALSGGAILNTQALWSAALSGALGSREPARIPWMRPVPQSEGVAVEWSLTGDIGRWQARLGWLMGGLPAAGVRLAGRVQASAALAGRGDDWQIARASAELENLVATGPFGTISEPRVVATAAGIFNPITGRIEISSGEMLSATASLRTGGFALQPAQAVAGGPLWQALARCRGKAQWQADVGRLEKWWIPAEEAVRWPVSGRVWGAVEVQETPAGLNVLLDATGNQLGLAAAQVPRAGAVATAPPTEVWAEPRARLLLEVTRGNALATGQGAPDELTINRLSVESSTLAMAASGRLTQATHTPQVELGGSLTYDWDMLSRLLVPWTGGRVRLVGAAGRPFMFRGPLTHLPMVALGHKPQGPAPEQAPAGSAAVNLPADWLANSGGAGGTREVAAQIALPVATEQPPADAAQGEWLRAVTIDTSTSWTAADIDGFQIDAGEMMVRLFEGQVALGPFDISASGGRLRAAPWIKLLPAPGEVIVPPGRIADRIALSGTVCERWISWIAPLLGSSTHTQGVVSIDLAGARLPLADPLAGECAGQLVFENLEVTPGATMAPLANLLVKLQSAVDPRFAFGDKAVLLRVRPQPVRMKLAGRRLWQEGLTMDMGQLVVRSAGSVGGDGSLAMTVEIALRAELAGTTPVVAQLLRTPLVIPLTGTVERPQLDASAIDTMVARIVENTAQAVLNDGINRGLQGLEEAFGNPQPAPAP